MLYCLPTVEQSLQAGYQEMSKKERAIYWLKAAEQDRRAARHLLEKKDYTYALFFGHLGLEKTLKAIWAATRKDTPPHTHRLTYLAERLELELSADQSELLETVTDFNLEARYPDEKFSFRRRCTKQFTEEYLKKITGFTAWLRKKITS